MRAAQIINRVFQTVPVIIGITLIVFLLMRLSGDPVQLMLGRGGNVAPGEAERLRMELGLDEPLAVQYLSFLQGILRWDFGNSIVTRAPVSAMIAERLPATIELTAAALAVSLLIAIPVGVVAAVRQYSTADKVGTVGSLVGVSMPDFWFGLVLMIVFSVHLHWLPISGRFGFGDAPTQLTGLYLVDSVLSLNFSALWESLRHLAMPAVTLGTAMAALTMRVTRSSMLEVIRQDYVTFARSKGLPERKVLIKHALRNALIPTVTVVALNMGVLLGGNMIVESVFGWPGLGRLVVDSIYNRDYPVVQAAVLIYALTYVALNLAADLLYTVLNPRVRW